MYKILLVNTNRHTLALLIMIVISAKLFSYLFVFLKGIQSNVRYFPKRRRNCDKLIMHLTSDGLFTIHLTRSKDKIWAKND